MTLGVGFEEVRTVGSPFASFGVEATALVECHCGELRALDAEILLPSSELRFEIGEFMIDEVEPIDAGWTVTFAGAVGCRLVVEVVLIRLLR